MNKNITVLGAGIVGICCAIELQQRGYHVQLIDRRGPGQETSSGNAGVLSLSSIVPLASPVLLPRLPRLALNLDADFRMHYPHLLHLLPWIFKFLMRCTRNTYIQDGLDMNILTKPSVAAHMDLIKDSKSQHLINHTGTLRLYRTLKTFNHDKLERELFDQCNLNYEIVDQNNIREIEPDISSIFKKGVHVKDSVWLNNPQTLCEQYANYFKSLGGTLIIDEINHVEQRSNQWHLKSASSTIKTDQLVMCLGPWTSTFIKQLGYSNPVANERGYHTILSPQSNKTLHRPIFDVDVGYVMIPMEMGLRITSGSNLTAKEAPKTPQQLDKIIPRAKELFPIDDVIMDKPWMGCRTSTPDSLPLIGPAPRHQNLWLAFGHCHMGYTMGPITGKIIANNICDQPQPFPVERYLPSRYL